MATHEAPPLQDKSSNKIILNNFTCVMSSRGNSFRVRLGDPMEGFRMGNRGDLEISCVARDSLGDLLGSMLILLVKGQTKSLQKR